MKAEERKAGLNVEERDTELKVDGGSFSVESRREKLG